VTFASGDGKTRRVGLSCAVASLVGEQRERGHWFRATATEVRRAISEHSLIELYRPSEAGERAAEREAAAAAKAEAAAALTAANAAERRQLRRERRRAAAELLVSGKTQVAVAEEVEVSDRTIRNWAKAKSFQRELASERAARQATSLRGMAASELLAIFGAWLASVAICGNCDSATRRAARSPPTHAPSTPAPSQAADRGSRQPT